MLHFAPRTSRRGPPIMYNLGTVAGRTWRIDVAFPPGRLNLATGGAPHPRIEDGASGDIIYSPRIDAS